MSNSIHGKNQRLSLALLWIGFLSVLGLMAWSWFSGGLCHELFRPDLSSADRITRLKAFFEDCGVLAPLVYVAFVTVEVIIAPIPGLMLYAPGGLLFGPWLGGTLAVIGNTIGAGISCLLARSLSLLWTDRFFSSSAMIQMQERLERRGALWIFLLRLNPLTSTDLLSYAAGFTRISAWRVMLATGLGMAPLCYAQSWISDSLFNRFPVLIYPLLALGFAYLAVVVFILHRQFNHRPASLNSVDASDDGQTS